MSLVELAVPSQSLLSFQAALRQTFQPFRRADAIVIQMV